MFLMYNVHFLRQWSAFVAEEDMFRALIVTALLIATSPLPARAQSLAAAGMEAMIVALPAVGVAGVGGTALALSFAAIGERGRDPKKRTPGLPFAVGVLAGINLAVGATLTSLGATKAVAWDTFALAGGIPLLAIGTFGLGAALWTWEPAESRIKLRVCPVLLGDRRAVPGVAVAVVGW